MMNVLVSTLGWSYAKILIVCSTVGSLVRCQTFRLQHKKDDARQRRASIPEENTELSVAGPSRPSQLFFFLSFFEIIGPPSNLASAQISIQIQSTAICPRGGLFIWADISYNSCTWAAI